MTSASQIDAPWVFDTSAGSPLAQWMDAQGLQAGAVEDVQALTGGTQNILLRFRRGTREFVLRRPPLQPRLDGTRTLLGDTHHASARKLLQDAFQRIAQLNNYQ